jgi:hypothetical protein
MKINIYDKELNRVAIVGERYISCFWSEGYNSTQPFALELNDTEEYRKKVQTDFYVGRDDRKTLMVIKSVQFAENKIIASGKQAQRVLDDVAFVGTINENQIIDKSIKNAYNLSNKYPLVDFAESGLGVKYKGQISNKSFLQLCEIMCQEEDVGFKAVKNGRAINVEFYQPTENPNLIFSKQIGNLSLTDILMSTEPYKNYAIVLGEGEGEQRVRVDVDASGGKQRLELIVDAKDIQKEEGETDTSYRSMLTARGIEKLLECNQTLKCSFTPSADDFGKRFDLGDVLTINLADYGLKIKSRIIRFSQTSQANKTETTVEVGQMTIKR